MGRRRDLCPQNMSSEGCTLWDGHPLPPTHAHIHIHTRAHTGTLLSLSRNWDSKSAGFLHYSPEPLTFLNREKRVRSVGGWMNARHQLFPGPCTPHFCPRRLPSLQWAQEFRLAGMVCSSTAALDSLGGDAGLWEADEQGWGHFFSVQRIAFDGKPFTWL